MAIHFTAEDWKRVHESHGKWWRGELERPLVLSTVEGAFDPGREKPLTPIITQANCHDFSISPEAIVDALDWDLASREFLGDAFPMVNMNVFGPGVLAAFCGAKLDNSSGRVWFFPEEKREIGDISIRYDPENVWVQRVKAIYRAAFEKWHGNVLMAMPDLGGVMDVVATFVGTEELLMDLIDEPEEVERLAWEAHEAWMQAYNDLMDVLKEGGNPGFSDWDGLLSKEPSYVLQSDFSYMIGPKMFDRFVLPHLEAACRKLGNVIYHLDGVGQIPHLDSLLSIENLSAIQWVPGDGQPKGRVWEEVYKKIADAGRGIEFLGGREQFLDLLKDYPRGLFYKAGFKDRAEAVRFLKAAGIPV